MNKNNKNICSSGAGVKMESKPPCIIGPHNTHIIPWDKTLQLRHRCDSEINTTVYRVARGRTTYHGAPSTTEFLFPKLD